MASNKEAGENLRGLVMQEVTKQLGPLAERVGLLGNNLERLYNSNGGPPGFLQTARKEDDGRFKMIFNILDQHKAELEPVTDYIKAHEIREEQREKFQNKRDQEIKDTFNERHQENVEKLTEISTSVSKKSMVWTIAGVLVGLAAIVVAICFGILTMKATHTTNLRQLILPDHVSTVYAHSQNPQQDAGSFQPIHY